VTLREKQAYYMGVRDGLRAAQRTLEDQGIKVPPGLLEPNSFATREGEALAESFGAYLEGCKGRP
jgi:hypothetical protein